MSANLEENPTERVNNLVKMDAATAMAGIFRPRRHGAKRESATVVKNWDGWRLEFRSASALGVEELDLLVALLAIAAREDRGGIISFPPTTQEGLTIRESVNCMGCLVGSDILTITTSWYEIERMRGNTPGHHADGIRESLQRLACTTLIVSCGEKETLQEGSVNLLGYRISGGRIAVALNSRASAAILGGQYTLLSLAEHQSLQGRGSEAARCLYLWLCAAVRCGQRRRFKTDTLTAHAWPSDGHSVPATQRKHRERLKLALSLISALPSWQISLLSEGLVEVERHPLHT